MPQGGREVDGILKGFDKLDNLVLDDCIEYLRGARIIVYLMFIIFKRLHQLYVHFVDPNDPMRVTENTRRLGLVVARGIQVSLLYPVDGMEEIANPFEDNEAEPVVEEA